jgi:hypothetical protein
VVCGDLDPRKVHQSLHTEIVPTLISIAFEGTNKNGDAMSDETADRAGVHGQRALRRRLCERCLVTLPVERQVPT